MRPRSKAVVGLIAGAVVLALPLPIAIVALNADTPEFTGIQDLPLPGGADLGDEPYTVTAEFVDVLSLVPQSAVKVNDVAVGRVSEIDLSDDDWTAKVTMRINGEVQLPANAYARIEQSSLLGEKYVQLIPPPEDKQVDAALGEGDDGTTYAMAAAPRGRATADIPLERTNRNPEVEEVFGALSLLLNGGGLDQLRTITTEMNKALDGNEPEITSMVRRVNTFTKNFDTHKEDLTDALDGVNKLTARLAGRKERVGTALEGLSPGLKTLEEQRGSLVTMLKSLDKLSTTAVETIDRSKEDMIADLKAIGTILKNLADAGQALPASLEVMLTYPFTDEVMNGIKGDYLNVYLRVTAADGTVIIPPISEDSVPQQPGTSGTFGTGNGSGTAVAPLPLPLPSVGPPATSTPSDDGSTPAGGDGGSGSDPSATPSDRDSASPSPSGSSATPESSPTQGEDD